MRIKGQPDIQIFISDEGYIVLKQRDDVSSAVAWRQAGIPPDVVNGVLRPFFSSHA